MSSSAGLPTPTFSVNTPGPPVLTCESLDLEAPWRLRVGMLSAHYDDLEATETASTVSVIHVREEGTRMDVSIGVRPTWFAQWIGRPPAAITEIMKTKHMHVVIVAYGMRMRHNLLRTSPREGKVEAGRGVQGS
jgi:hypothetical protein